MGIFKEDGFLKDIIHLSPEFVVLNLEVCDFLLIIFVVLKKDVDIRLYFTYFVDLLPQNSVLRVEVFKFRVPSI